MKKLQVLGTGCPKCRELAENAGKAARSLGIDCEIEKVTDIGEIIGMGVMITPALAVDGRVLVSGRVPEPAEIAALLVQDGGD